MTRSENTELLSDLPQDQRLPVSLEQRDSLMRVPRSIILISTCIGLSLFGDQLVYTVLPIIHSEVGITVAQIGFCVSANRFIRILTNVGATVIISKFGRKWPFIISLVIAAIITTAYGFIHGFVAFVVARLIWGMCWSFLRLEGMNTVLDLADNKTKGRFMGFYQSIARLGGSFGMLGGGILTDALGFRSTFSIFGLLTALAPFLAFFEMQKRSLPSSMAIPEAKQSNEQIDTPTTNSLTVPTATVTLISPMEGEKTEEVKTKSLPNKESEKYNLRQSKQDQSTDCEAPSSQNLTLPAKKSVGDLVEELPPTTWQVTILYLCGFSNRLVIDGMCGTLLGFLLKQRYGEEPAIFSTVTVPVASLTGTLLSSRGFIELFVAPLAGHLGDTWGRYGVCLHAFSNVCMPTIKFMIKICNNICCGCIFE